MGRTIQRNYVLNDTAALKKKIKHENRKDAFNQGVEARDCSNMVLLLKTSFFEHVKNRFISDIMNREEITDVKNAVGAKVDSESSGEAFVEYSLDIQFKVQNSLYVVKVIAYTTTCKVLFQPVNVYTETKVVNSKNRFPGTLWIISFCLGVRKHIGRRIMMKRH